MIRESLLPAWCAPEHLSFNVYWGELLYEEND